MTLFCVPLNSAVEASSENLHLEQIKSNELSLCLSGCSNSKCIIKGETNGRVLQRVFLKSCKSCEFMSLGLVDLSLPFWFPLARSLYL